MRGRENVNVNGENMLGCSFIIHTGLIIIEGDIVLIRGGGVIRSQLLERGTHILIPGGISIGLNTGVGIPVV